MVPAASPGSWGSAVLSVYVFDDAQPLISDVPADRCRLEDHHLIAITWSIIVTNRSGSLLIRRPCFRLCNYSRPSFLDYGDLA